MPRKLHRGLFFLPGDPQQLNFHFGLWGAPLAHRGLPLRRMDRCLHLLHQGDKQLRQGALPLTRRRSPIAFGVSNTDELFERVAIVAFERRLCTSLPSCRTSCWPYSWCEDSPSKAPLAVFSFSSPQRYCEMSQTTKAIQIFCTIPRLFRIKCID